MARLFTSGFEMQDKLFEQNTATVAGAGTIAIDTTTIHKIATKGGLASLKASGGEAVLRATGLFTGAKERWTFYRFYFNVSALPGASKEIFRPIGVGSESLGSVQLLSTGGVRILNDVFETAISEIGKVTKETWNSVEIAVWAHATEEAKGKIKARLNLGTTTEVTNVKVSVAAPEGFRCGWLTSEATASIFFDDIAINDETGEKETGFPAEGIIGHCVPISDKARTGFTAGAGGTEKLWEALDNAPPTGVVLASATNGSQIKDGTSNTTDNVEENLTTYTSLGVGASDTLKVVQGVFASGYSTITSQVTGGALASNPEIAEVTKSSGAVAAATHPTGWSIFRSVITYAPSVTLGSSPVVKLRKGTATVNSAMFEYAALLVEWLPTNEYSKSVSETLSTSEIPSRATTLTRVPAESLAASDSVKRQTVIARSISESLSLTDSLTRSGTFARSTNETLSASDAIKRVITNARLVAESIVLSESVKRATATFRSITQTIETSDATAQTSPGSYARSVLESLAASDTAKRAYTGARSISESLSTNDVITALKVTSRSIEESLSTSDTVKRSTAITRAITQSISTSEIPSRSSSILRTLAESLSASDSPSRATGVTRGVSQSLSTSDLVISLQGFKRTINESLSSVDVVKRIFSGARNVILEIVTSDVVTRSTPAIRNVNDVIATSDTPKRQITAIRQSFENILTSDSTEGRKSFFKTITESLITSDSNIRTVGIVRNPSDTTTVSDLVTRIFQGFRSILNQVTGTDTPEINIRLIYHGEEITELSIEEPRFTILGSDSMELTTDKPHTYVFDIGENELLVNVFSETISVNRPNLDLVVTKTNAHELTQSKYDDQVITNVDKA